MESFQIIIIFLEKNGFDLYTPTQESFIRFSFTKELFQDMEVMNSEKFIAEITSFITKYAIPPAPVVILISENLLFIKDIQTLLPSEDEKLPPKQMSATDQQKLIQDFLDTVPFEVIESKTFPIEGGLRIVATNKTLYDDILSAFEKNQATVKAVIPAFILGTKNEGEGLDDEVITTTISTIESLKQESFLVHQQDIMVAATPEEKKKEFLSLPKKQTKLYAYVGVFVVLFGIFGVMLKGMLDSNTKVNKPLETTPITSQLPVAVATPTTAIPINSYVATTSAAIDKSQIKIQIETSPATAVQGQLIKNKLLEKGYTNEIITSNAPAATQKTLVMLSTTLNPTTQQEITGVISNIFTNFSTQQSSQALFDITIIPSNNL